MARIMLIDDDQSLLELLSDYLGRLGYEIEALDNGPAALAQLGPSVTDLVILDVSMPGLDGWQVLERIRTTSAVPIIMLTARGDEPDVLRGFAGGTDDYITKPFSFAQLAARIRAVLDRATPGHTLENNVLRGGDLVVDIDRHRVTRSGQPIELTPTEFRILVTLMERPGKVLSARQIVSAVWGAEYAEQAGYIRRYVWHLRRKLERDPHQPAYILNERSVGYRFGAGS